MNKTTAILIGAIIVVVCIIGVLLFVVLRNGGMDLSGIAGGKEETAQGVDFESADGKTGDRANVNTEGDINMNWNRDTNGDGVIDEKDVTYTPGPSKNVKPSVSDDMKANSSQVGPEYDVSDLDSYFEYLAQLDISAAYRQADAQAAHEKRWSEQEAAALAEAKVVYEIEKNQYVSQEAFKIKGNHPDVIYNAVSTFDMKTRFYGSAILDDTSTYDLQEFYVFDNNSYVQVFYGRKKGVDYIVLSADDTGRICRMQGNKIVNPQTQEQFDIDIFPSAYTLSSLDKLEDGRLKQLDKSQITAWYNKYYRPIVEAQFAESRVSN